MNDTNNQQDEQDRIVEEIAAEDIARDDTLEADIPEEVKPVSQKRSIKQWLAEHKKVVIAVAGVIILVLGILFVLPATRYSILGSIIKKTVAISVVDQSTKKPISGVEIEVNAKRAMTDAKGIAKITDLPVGPYKVKAAKKHYSSSEKDMIVPVLKNPETISLSLNATGRTVTVRIVNVITKESISGAAVVIDGSTTLTDSKGDAKVVLAPSGKEQTGKVSKYGYNDSTISVVVKNEDEQKVERALTPGGAVYFLSKRTGKINVMKSNLDGTDIKVVLEGTGKESDNETMLLASSDWKYLALIAMRDSDKQKVYLINTTNSSLTTIDDGNDARFSFAGWVDHRIVYSTNRAKQAWESGTTAIKSYNADTGEQKTLDETAATGDAWNNYTSQYFSGPYIVDNRVVYARIWLASLPTQIADKRQTIISVMADGSNRKNVKEFASADVSYVEMKRGGFKNIYIRTQNAQGQSSFYEYTTSDVLPSAVRDANFYAINTPVYMISPDQQSVLWHEPRDGKFALFVGDKDGNNPRQLGLSEYSAYGWMGSDYILLSKKGSELYVMSAKGVIDEKASPFKINDYHKPNIENNTYMGYGGGM